MNKITDIFVQEVEGGGTFQFPMLPDRIGVSAATRFLSFDIMSSGEHVMPLGEELTGFKWQGLLPGESRKGAPYIRAWADPSAIQSKWSHWRHAGVKLRLTVPGTPINHAVYLKTYNCEYSGGSGDAEYSIEFVLAKEIIVGKDGENTAAKNSTGYVVTASSRRIDNLPAKTYTVKAGDTLWKIAQKTLGDGSRWQEIYALNKSVVGANPNMIYAGQVYNLPG